jgi:hypothetical protein
MDIQKLVDLWEQNKCASQIMQVSYFGLNTLTACLLFDATPEGAGSFDNVAMNRMPNLIYISQWYFVFPVPIGTPIINHVVILVLLFMMDHVVLPQRPVLEYGAVRVYQDRWLLGVWPTDLCNFSAAL